jgi:3-methyl-2-oxobutanoate hydroxymethyltransferase
MTAKAVTTTSLKKMKADGKKITMLTAYDYPSAKLADQAGIDVILVGDSLGMVVLGYDTTIPVTVADMVYHTRAVTRAVTHALVVTDLPFLSYHGTWQETLKNAGEIIQKGNAKAVKLEGGREVAETVKRLTQAGIPVMGHIGLTPQSVNQLGGFRVQGKTKEAARALIEDAKILEEAGCFALVLECIPAPLAKLITEKIEIPTIGIGAGVDCDGQVLVFHDMLGYGGEHYPKFVKKYAEIGITIEQAIRTYIDEVKTAAFPQEEHSYGIDADLLSGLYGEGERR